MNINEKTAAIVDALEDIKASDILVMDTSRLSAMFERVIVASADSSRQTRALAGSVKDRMRELNQAIIGSEGEGTGEWVLVDLGDVVVHIMHHAIRAHYNLEELWGAQIPIRRNAL